MVVIRRMVDRQRAYTAILLPGEPPRIFPTSDHEHARILQIYLQDRPHAGVHNDFSDFALGRDALPGALPTEKKNPARAAPREE
jgi:hypothetical protein